MLTVLLCCPLNARAQTLNMNQYGVEEGLPQSSIACLEQDFEGNIWIGTLSGVAKYNGLKFENFSRKDGLVEHRVVSSALDKNGNIWFGHYWGGITFYDHKTKKFIGLGKSNDQINSYILCLEADPKGYIWIGTQSDGLFFYAPTSEEASGKYGNQLNGKLTSVSLPSKVAINAIKALKDGRILIATSKGVFEIEKIGNSPTPLTAKWNLPEKSFTAIIQTQRGEIWLGTENSGIFVVKNNRLVKSYGTSHGITDLNITCLLEDSFNNIFVGTKAGGVFKFLRQLEENNYSGYVFQSIGVNQGLSNNHVTDILQDRENNIWIGTALNLNQYFDEQFEIYGNHEGLSNSLIWSIAQDKKGRFWLGTDGGLVMFLRGENPNRCTFENVTQNKGIKGNATSLYIDENGTIWFAANKNGLYAYNPDSKSLSNFSTKDGLSSNDINCITGDGKGKIFIGTHGGGLSIFTPASKSFKNYSFPMA